MSRPKKKTTVEIFRKKYSLRVPEALSAELRKQAGIKVKIMRSISKTPKTPKEISEDTGIPTETVFWYLMTFYKYGLVEAVEKTDEGYFKYIARKR